MAGRKKKYYPPVTTNFFAAYQRYKLTEDYKRAYRLISRTGLKDPYIDNWIHAIFANGWGDSEIYMYNTETGERVSTNNRNPFAGLHLALRPNSPG